MPKSPPTQRPSPRRGQAAKVDDDDGDDDDYDDDDEFGSSTAKPARRNSQIIATPEAVRSTAPTARRPYRNLRSSA